MPSDTPLILIVEDDDAISELMQIILLRAGFRVRAALDGDLGLVRMQAEHPDLVILDIMMPRTSGFDVLRSMRESDWGREVPVLMTTAAERPDRIVEAIRYGASDYIMKPFLPEALLAAVERLLRGDVLAGENSSVAVRAVG